MNYIKQCIYCNAVFKQYHPNSPFLHPQNHIDINEQSKKCCECAGSNRSTYPSRSTVTDRELSITCRKTDVNTHHTHFTPLQVLKSNQQS